MWGFVAALTLAVIGKAFPGSRDSNLWVAAFMVALVLTSFGQNLLAAAYNGLVSSLFFNFFFTAQGNELSFDTTGDWWLALAFVAVGVLAALLGRWISRRVEEPHREPLKAATTDEHQSFLWDARSTNGPTSNKEKSWTR